MKLTGLWGRSCSISMQSLQCVEVDLLSCVWCWRQWRMVESWWVYRERVLLNWLLKVSSSSGSLLFIGKELIEDSSAFVQLCKVQREWCFKQECILQHWKIPSLVSSFVLLSFYRTSMNWRTSLCVAPGGCTIAGLLALEDGKVRSTVARCIQATTEHAAGLGRK